MSTYATYVENPLVKQNLLRGRPPEQAPLPDFAQARALLPEPHWEGRATTLDCYWKTWELAFRNLRQPQAGSGFVANFIDTAFNDCLFMWDSAFILMFARYGARAFNFQRTLDNFYAKQHPDGFICREIQEADGQDRFQRFDPTSTGPNILPWAEWDYYLNFGDRERLARVLPPLVAFHQWLRTYRTWPDGTYWASGWACGMDNQPRMEAGYHACFSHGHMSWIDTCLQQVLSARLLVLMNAALGQPLDLADLTAEAAQLIRFVNRRMWDQRAQFYCDRFANGRLSGVKSIGAYWALLAGALPRRRLGPFVAHLEELAEFDRPHRVPSLAADHPQYQATGGYWLGAVWAPTNYMVLRGLRQVGRDDLAHAIALNHLGNVVAVFETTGTLWENYAPEAAAPGQPARKDFVGWTGLPPVAVLFEYVFGIQPDVPRNRLVWDVRLLEEHGIERYPFGTAGLLDLQCGRRGTVDDRPAIAVRSNVPLDLVIRWAGGMERRHVRPG